MRSVTVSGFKSQDINRAVRECQAAGGGEVLLPAGRYQVDCSITLFSNITLRGEGKSTILVKSEGCFAHLAQDADYNQRHFVLNKNPGFYPGMGIQIYNTQEKDCWGVTVTEVIEAEDIDIRCSGYMERDYEKGCKVSNAFPVISAVNVKDVHIENLVIDGNGEKNDYINGCKGGAIYFLKARDCVIDGVEIYNFNGDGISWQTTERIIVTNSEVRNCTGFGLHPGAGSQHSLVEGCKLHHNGEVGLFLCWRVKYGVFRNNDIYENGFSGISIGHRDTDNEIIHNRITKNHCYGIYFRPEKPENASHRNHILKNRIWENGKSEADAICVENDAEDLEIEFEKSSCIFKGKKNESEDGVWN